MARVVLAAAWLASGRPAGAEGPTTVTTTTIEQDRFGVTADGIPVDRYTLRNAAGTSVRLITFGATVTELWVPDRHGNRAAVVLGFDDLALYERSRTYFGCTVGRVAFRIDEGRFTLDGRPVQLSINAAPHHLHGGTRGLSKVVWRADPMAGPAGQAVRFTCRSPDGDQGYPGTLVGKGGVASCRHAGLFLETGHLPDSVNRPEFPSIILRPGATYTQTCVYRFGVETQ
jgi:aldose 1-epimerase